MRLIILAVWLIRNMIDGKIKLKPSSPACGKQQEEPSFHRRFIQQYWDIE